MDQPALPKPTPGDLVAVAELLKREYVPDRPTHSDDPLDELVATILSQHTSDRNSQRAFRSLKATFPRWSAGLFAGVDAIAQAIQTGGLARQKAPWVMGLLEALPKDQTGEPTLSYLAHMSPTAAYEHLQAFAGVGPKTAACTLLFAYGWPLFPVDVHVHRVARRLGWAGDKEPADRLQARLAPLVPPEHVYPLHMGLVRHGRQVCRPQRPDCLRCVIRVACNQWVREQVSSAGDDSAGSELPAANGFVPESGREPR